MKYTDFNYGTSLTYQVKFDCLLQGYGSFEGQTLQFSYRGITGQTWEGYLLTPK